MNHKKGGAQNKHGETHSVPNGHNYSHVPKRAIKAQHAKEIEEADRVLHERHHKSKTL